MKNKLSLLMVIHFHQPVGNFDFVIEKITDECYEPFLDTISEFSDIRFNLHFSGILLNWFKSNKPLMITKIRELALNKQVELVGGGFYEPILSALSPEDANGQIEMLSDFIMREFNFRVKGCWIAERVWQQHLAQVLQRAGIKYVILDDIHLRFAGLDRKDLYGHYMTEQDGCAVSVFGADKLLRYSIPFMPVKETIGYLKGVRSGYNARAVLYGDDGEKFGAWPNTHILVYEKRWLRDFLKALRRNSGWLKTDTLSEYLAENTPLGRIYLPDSSYQEMNEWSMLPDAAAKLRLLQGRLKEKGVLELIDEFLRAGVWKNFFVKYPESNHIHKRSLLVSSRLHSLRNKGSNTAKLKEAEEELYKSQCNCAYWHGVFGGIYLYHLRTALYRHLISAESIIERLEHKENNWLNIETPDFDCDGCDEIIISTADSGFIINPSVSGSITEWDLKPKQLNLLNTLSRRKEAYHKDFQGSHGRHIHYDSYRRALFIDRFLEDNITHADLISGRYRDRGSFSSSAYNIVKTEAPKATVKLKSRGRVRSLPVQMDKIFDFKRQQKGLVVKYRIKNLSAKRINLNFAPEMNFSLTSYDKKERFKSAGRITLRDDIEDIDLAIDFSKKAKDIFIYPVKTISRSQKEPEYNYQATCIMPVFSLPIKGNGSRVITITLSIST